MLWLSGLEPQTQRDLRNRQCGAVGEELVRGQQTCLGSNSSFVLGV